MYGKFAKNNDMSRLFVAPLQGYTEAPFRHFHSRVYGSENVTYMTPFVRMEKGEPRHRDMRDVTSQLNGNHRVIPQIIFRDAAEFAALTQALIEAGHDNVNLNMGCPFPPQCHKGRGAAMIRNREALEQICDIMHTLPTVTFSVKMRIGLNAPDEWRAIAPILRQMPLEFVTVHPRVASQQYSGELHTEQLLPLAEAIGHNVIFNGDITHRTDITSIENEMPFIAGVMAGRGLLARPSLFSELTEQREWPRERRIEYLMRFHDLVFGHLSDTLCGDAQILSKIKAFWDYAEAEIGRKPYKLIHKATSLSRYQEAVMLIR